MPPKIASPPGSRSPPKTRFLGRAHLSPYAKSHLDRFIHSQGCDQQKYRQPHTDIDHATSLSIDLILYLTATLQIGSPG